ncbi:MAG: hypothetical protein EXR07_20810 [Acetobacteraceae bacterium]|nr:hypothetical protein [Acetobacteraceae bacterium]
MPSSAERAEWAGKLLRGIPIRELRMALEASPDHAAFRAIGQDIRSIQDTGLFDAVWYRRRYPDADDAGMSPARHYVTHGAREDRAPNPWFDPVWYRATHGLTAHEHPLFHYVSIGEAQGLRPSPNFDPAWYRATYNLNAKYSALADFLRRRRARTVAPCAEMWPALGLPERRLTGIADDIFLSIGDEPADYLALRDEGLFDDNYYALHSGDVLASGTDLLRHYCAFGWRENRQPNFYFDCRWYAATNPEVVQLGVNPLAHYLLLGEAEGRRPIVFFDPVWYRAQYDVPEELAALAHFLAHRREGKVSPNEFFDPIWYAAQKGETVRPGRDPFARFLVNGLTEDFSPSPRFDPADWRRRSMGRASRHFRHLMDPAKDNPLVHYLLSTYR